jgi:hypothetical protein
MEKFERDLNLYRTTRSKKHTIDRISGDGCQKLDWLIERAHASHDCAKKF